MPGATIRDQPVAAEVDSGQRRGESWIACIHVVTARQFGGQPRSHRGEFADRNRFHIFLLENDYPTGDPSIARDPTAIIAALQDRGWCIIEFRNHYPPCGGRVITQRVQEPPE